MIWPEAVSHEAEPTESALLAAAAPASAAESAVTDSLRLTA